MVRLNDDFSRTREFSGQSDGRFQRFRLHARGADRIVPILTRNPNRPLHALKSIRKRTEGAFVGLPLPPREKSRVGLWATLFLP